MVIYAADFFPGFLKNMISKSAASKDIPAPNTNGTAVPKAFHKKPQIMLAGSKAIPVMVECSPNMVPVSSLGDISAIKARSTPAVIAVNTPYRIKMATKDNCLVEKAKPKYTMLKVRYPTVRTFFLPILSDSFPKGMARRDAVILYRKYSRITFTSLKPALFPPAAAGRYWMNCRG